MIGLLALEQKAWMSEKERNQFFELLDVPKHLIPSFSTMKVFKEYPVGSFLEGDLTTVEIVRPFVTLPRWLKNRIKYRLRHPAKFEAEAFMKAKGSLSVRLNTRAATFNSFIERILRNE